MTEKEAIEWLNAISAIQKDSIHKSSLLKRKEALHMAIQALEKQTMANEILHEWTEAREKIIEEFAVQLCNELPRYADEITMEDCIIYDVLTVDGVLDIVLQIAERMKNGETN